LLLAPHPTRTSRIPATGAFLPPSDFTEEALHYGYCCRLTHTFARPHAAPIIRLAAKGYEGSVRSWDHFIDDKGRLRKDADTGDTLVTFIIREFGDIHNEAASTGDQLEVARAAVAAAIGNLERVLAALDDADESQAGGHNNDLDAPPPGVTEPS
jgi:hypothetical protein